MKLTTNDTSPINISDSYAHQTKIDIGISSCLLGQRVRFDGGHKHLDFATHELMPFVNFVPAPKWR